MIPTEETSAQNDFSWLLEKSRELEGPMGAIAFAVLEMFRRGGMNPTEVTALHDQMKTYFMIPTNAECNDICAMVETRLREEKTGTGRWYENPSKTHGEA